MLTGLGCYIPNSIAPKDFGFENGLNCAICCNEFIAEIFLLT